MNKPKRLQKIPEYVFSALNKKIKAVEERTGKKVLNFGPGNPTFPPKKEYIEKLKEFYDDPKAYLYPGYGPSDDFINAIIGWYKKRFGVDLVKEEVFALNGGKDGLSHLAFALTDLEDEVLVPDPAYPTFEMGTILAGAVPVKYDLTEENSFKINLEELQKKITPRTRYIWVNYPSNPTGQVATLEELKEIVDFAIKNNILVVYDNPYSEITYDGFVAPSILQIPEARDIAIEMNSFSKLFSFAGFRMGWVAGNKEIVQNFARVKSQFDSGLSRPLDMLGAYVLNNYSNEWHDAMITEYKRRRDIIAENLKKIGLRFEMPKAALYIWAKIPDEYENSEGYSDKMLEEKQILFTPGSAYGKNGDRYVRVSISIDISNIESYFN